MLTVLCTHKAPGWSSLRWMNEWSDHLFSASFSCYFIFALLLRCSKLGLLYWKWPEQCWTWMKRPWLNYGWFYIEDLGCCLSIYNDWSCYFTIYGKIVLHLRDQEIGQLFIRKSKISWNLVKTNIPPPHTHLCLKTVLIIFLIWTFNMINFLHFLKTLNTKPVSTVLNWY